MSRLALACLVSFALLALPVSALSGGPNGRIWVVDSEGIGDFTEIQPAIDSASHGDTILIRYSPMTCCYDGFEVVGKGLTLVGVGDGPRFVSHATMRNLGSARQLVVSNLDFNWDGQGHLFLGAPTLQILSCAGPVRIENCRIQGESAEFNDYTTGQPAVRVSASDDVVFQGCELSGGMSGFYSGQYGVGAPGLTASDSDIAVYQSIVEGGEGGIEVVLFNFYGLDGGDGIAVTSGNVYVADSTLVGGPGGSGDSGGIGGDGLALAQGSQGIARNTVMMGSFGWGGSGSPYSGNVVEIEAGTASLEAAQSQLEGEPLKVRVLGNPGDDVVVRVSRETQRSFVGMETGYTHVGAPIDGGLLQLGVIPASGILSVDLDSPVVTMGETDRYFVQATLTDPLDIQRNTGVRTVEWLGSSFGDRCLERIHVDWTAAPGGDGRSWSTAFNDLHVALATVGECPPGTVTEVWIASGVYTPEGPGGDQTRRFNLRSGTRLLGGFRGSEVDAGERRPDLYPTILSGDLNGDDGEFGERSDNSDGVASIGGRIWSAHDIWIDAVTIECAGSPSTFSTRGGGLHIYGDAVLNNLLIRDHETSSGGGVYISEGDVRMYNCRVVDNVGTSRGGGVYVASEDSTLELVQCVLAGNHSFRGGGLYASSHASVKVLNTTVFGNKSPNGAGLQLSSGVDLIVANSILWGNRSATLTGQEGQLYLQSSGNSVTLQNSCVQDLDGSLGGDGNIDREPLFMGDAPASQAGGAYDLRLASGSPGIDAGRNDLVPLDTLDLDGDGDVTEPLPFDLKGRPRFVSGIPRSAGTGPHPRVDMGAHEASQPRLRPLGQ